MQRVTIQRKIILDAIHSAGHIKTQELIDNIGKDYPNFSVATIYRNLNVLEQDGLVRKVTSNLNENIYEDTCKDEHDHFICEDCGIILDKEKKDSGKLYMDQDGNLITNKSITYYGVCKSCLSCKKS